MRKFVFLDIYTQKLFVENFGSRAIANCSEIRENLMDLTHMAIKHKVPILALMKPGNDPEYEKIPDTLAENTGVDQIMFEDEAEMFDYLSTLAPDSVFVYGVPFETKVAEIVQALSGKKFKVWLVADAVKGYHEIPFVELSGVKTITTRNLEKFISI